MFRPIHSSVHYKVRKTISTVFSGNSLDKTRDVFKTILTVKFKHEEKNGLYIRTCLLAMHIPIRASTRARSYIAQSRLTGWLFSHFLG